MGFLAAQLAMLAEAHGDPALLAEAGVELSFGSLDEAERHATRDALAAAAIPHWFDAAILGALLEVDDARAAELAGRLHQLAIVEPFPARGAAAYNVHEASRLALRKRLAQAQVEQFGRYSDRAMRWFADRRDPTAAVELVFHALGTGTPQAVDGSGSIRDAIDADLDSEMRDALGRAAQELLDADLVQGAARAEALLAVNAARWMRGEEASIETPMSEALALAREHGLPWCEVQALCLLSDALLSQGNGEAAGERAADAVERAKQLPAEPALRRRCAIAEAHFQRAQVAYHRGEAKAALNAYGETTRLVIDLLRDGYEAPRGLHFRAACAAGLGDALAQAGEHAAALESYTVQLESSERLAAWRPDDRSLQRDVSLAHGRVGDAHRDLGHAGEALAAYDRSRDIAERLYRADGSRTDWTEGHARAEFRRAVLLLEQKRHDEAQAALATAEMLYRELVARDPRDTANRDLLANVLSWWALLLNRTGQPAQAEPLARESMEIYAALLGINAATPSWLTGLSGARDLRIDVLRTLGRDAEADALQSDIEPGPPAAS